MRVHPRFLLSDEEMTVAALWRDHTGGGFSVGPLPFAGGTADQPALVMDAFKTLSYFAALVKPEK